MPDWSYHTLFRPVLFRLRAERGRDLILGALGNLASLPGGTALIAMLGHMRPPAELLTTAFGLDLASPVGLGSGLDRAGVASAALARFGFGLLELGPVTTDALPSGLLRRDSAQQSIGDPTPLANAGLAALVRRLGQLPKLGVPLGVRISPMPGSSLDQACQQLATLAKQLDPMVGYLSLMLPETAMDGRWTDSQCLVYLRAAIDALSRDKPLLLYIPADLPWQRAELLTELASSAGLRGVIVGGGIADGAGGRLFGLPERTPVLALLRSLSQRWGDQLCLVAAGGICEPADALSFYQAGATLVHLDSGLVYGGPGLAKRINEALLVRRRPALPAQGWKRISGAWIWLLLLGLGMLFGGLLAGLLAATRVVLPYDEAFVGLTRAELSSLNPRLLPFMAHDRISLAGVMLAIGILYTALAWFGIRRRVHWAKQVLVLSACIGFLSFFLFLGFGYFDPLHALVSLILLTFFALGTRWRATGPPDIRAPDLSNDRSWLAACWGQLLLIGLAVGIIAAGSTIAAVGASSVFVPEDLAFMRTTSAKLEDANSRLLPLIAHDRAGFGGALVSLGLAVLLSALWGVRRGARWLWWTFLLSGLAALCATLGVHMAVGYLDLWHLAPALLAALVFAVGMGLCYQYMCAPDAG